MFISEYEPEVTSITELKKKSGREEIKIDTASNITVKWLSLERTPNYKTQGQNFFFI